MRRTSPLLAALVLLTPACHNTEDIVGVADSEVDAIQTTRESAITAEETVVTPQVVHVRLGWGYLAWKGRAAKGVTRGEGISGFDWTGGLSVSDGTATLDMSTFLEPGDSAAAGEANEVKWISHTYPHFDGVIATLTPATVGASLVIDTPSFKKTLAVSELLAAGEQRFTVDDTGRELSISPLPDQDAACSGFVVGFLRPEDATLHFKGLRLSKLGDRLGKLRFDAVDGVIAAAEVVDEDGNVLETGSGTIDTSAKTFSITLAAGTVVGTYEDPSYSTRGAFNATARCN